VTTLVGLSNLVLGAVYTCYGLMTARELKQGWRTLGFSHFGFAWLCMAFTCGPHHLDHGLHVLLGRSGGALDLLTIAVGFPVGVIWFLLRVEAMLGGPGDRTIVGSPSWLRALPTAGAVYLAAITTAVIALLEGVDEFIPRTLPNVALVVLYGAIGALLLRAQLQNHAVTRTWSVSGLSLSLVMITCAVMHGVFVAYVHDGRYELDWHGLVIDTVAVPAAAYFLWVTFGLYRGTLRDWNQAPEPDAAGRPPDSVLLDVT